MIFYEKKRELAWLWSLQLSRATLYHSIVLAWRHGTYTAVMFQKLESWYIDLKMIVKH